MNQRLGCAAEFTEGSEMLEWTGLPLGGLAYLGGRQYRRYTHRRKRAVQRVHAAARGEAVSVPMLWEDAAGRQPTSIPRWLNGYLTVVVHDGGLRPGSGHPLLFGDFEEFWRRCLADARADDLPRVSEPDDILLLPRLPYPPGARAFLVMAPDDWRIVSSSSV